LGKERSDQGGERRREGGERKEGGRREREGGRREEGGREGGRHTNSGEGVDSARKPGEQMRLQRNLRAESLRPHTLGASGRRY
jgi:ATP-dependent RNA helicase DeaD